MRTYCPFPPCVSIRIGTWVALADGLGAGAPVGTGEPPAWSGACGAQPAIARMAAGTSPSFRERIGPYYGDRERHDLEDQREDQADRVDPAVDQQGDGGGGEGEAQR